MLLPLLMVCLAAGDEWATMPTPAPAQPPPPPTAPAPAPAPAAKTPDLTPRARYETALRYLAGQRPADASAILDLLIAEFPRVPEYFAARAQAQLALQAPLFASADAQYALALKPELINTRYTLATAEEALGHAANAAYHYRLYADSPLPEARPEHRAEAQRRAARLTATQPPPPGATPQPYTPQPYAPAATPAPASPSCRMGTDGRQACGYNCRMGTDGVMACADTPDGVCAMGTDGRVTCSRVGGGGSGFGSAPPPECRMGTDGRQTCGYNCRMGTNGRMYCASRPDGQCAMNTNGTFSCP
ncbi:MAG: hypothetical protein ACOZQL_40585 [Myxococcota bacterium]